MDSFNDTSSAATLLATRRSGKAREMVAPGPDAAQLQAILGAAARVPDHGKLNPWRFVVIENRAAFADALLAIYLAGKPEAGRLEREAVTQFATQAPCLVAVIAAPKPSHIPLWEQELSVGAACQNLCLAAHAHGLVANWLTGWAAYDDKVLALLGGAAPERIAGFVFIGTQEKPLEERPRPDLSAVVSHWRG
ncbi:nitroreductase family protein [Sandarakinorhabdus rubra]|uniref:nitroreductase family protein n=1 Tax=Sandarakinorhabdus rubra TaxID=2672568 RepID=UPI0013DD098D|nr:nitroreductase [Sandarakinorhabdus rubra]